MTGFTTAASCIDSTRCVSPAFYEDRAFRGRIDRRTPMYSLGFNWGELEAGAIVDGARRLRSAKIPRQGGAVQSQSAGPQIGLVSISMSRASSENAVTLTLRCDLLAVINRRCKPAAFTACGTSHPTEWQNRATQRRRTTKSVHCRR